MNYASSRISKLFGLDGLSGSPRYLLTTGLITCCKGRRIIPPQELTVKEFLRDFVKIYGTSHWALSTYESNCSLIANYINPTIGDVAVQDITPKYVDEFYIRLQKTKPLAKKNRKPQTEYLTPGTIHSIHKILRCASEQAIKWEIIARNPFPHANKPKTNYKKRDIWTADMIRKALDECDDMKLYVTMNLAFACSMLRPGKFNLSIGTITGIGCHADKSTETKCY